MRGHKHIKLIEWLTPENALRPNSGNTHTLEKADVGGDGIHGDPSSIIEIVVPDLNVVCQLAPLFQEIVAASVEWMLERQHIRTLGIQVAVPDHDIRLRHNATLRWNISGDISKSADDYTRELLCGATRQAIDELKLQSSISAILVAALAVVFGNHLATLWAKTDMVAVVHLRKVVDAWRVRTEFCAIFLDKFAKVRPDNFKHILVGKAELTAAIGRKASAPIPVHREIFGMVFCVFRRLAIRKIRVRRIIGTWKVGEGMLRFKLRPPGTATRTPGEVAAVRCTSLRIDASPQIVAAHIKCVLGSKVCNWHCALSLHYIRIVTRNKAEVIVGIALQELCYRISCCHAGIRKNVRYSWTDHYPKLAAHQLAGIEPRLLSCLGIAEIDAHRRDFCRLAFRD